MFPILIVLRALDVVAMLRESKAIEGATKLAHMNSLSILAQKIAEVLNILLIIHDF